MPIISHSSVYNTGRIENKKQVGIKTLAYVPFGFNYYQGINDSHAFYFEFGSELAAYGVNVGYLKQIEKRDNIFTSAGMEFSSLWGMDMDSPEDQFNALRFSGEYTKGHYLSNHFGIYIPIKLEAVWYRWKKKNQSITDKAIGLCLLPGLGFTFEYKWFVLRQANNIGLITISKNGIDFPFNNNIGPKIGSYVVAPYVGLMIGGRW